MKIDTEITQKLDFSCGSVWGWTHPGEDASLSLTFGDRATETYLLPSEVAVLSKVLPKIMKFYKENDVDTRTDAEIEADNEG